MAAAVVSDRRWFSAFLVTIFFFFFVMAIMWWKSVGLVVAPSVGYASGGVTLNLSRPAPTSHRTKGVRLAYLVSGSKGDAERLWRCLRALYHPRNQYVVHLDLEAPAEERLRLAWLVGNDPVLGSAGNVQVVRRANMVTYRGSTMVANTLHACARLLRSSAPWDWFINLSASDYPLYSQDDLLYAFSRVPRNTNFVEHTSRLGWKNEMRARPLMVDPGLYSANKSDVFFVREKRSLPSAFRLFTGSAWMALTREFVEYCVWGYDNLPRTLLMYYTNFVSSPEGYFHTVICNAPSFNTTVANHDLHYISWDSPPKQHPRSLGINDTKAMIESNAPFARKFPRDDPILDKIDIELLHKSNESFTLGGWCKGKPKCTKIGNPERLKPSPRAKQLVVFMNKVATSHRVAKYSCR